MVTKKVLVEKADNTIEVVTASSELSRANPDSRFTQDIRELSDKLREAYPKSLIVLFGSCAKNTAKFNSDIDIAVVLPDDLFSDREQRRKMRTLRSELSVTDSGIEADIVFLTESSWKDGTGLFVQNIKEWGVEL